MRRKSASSCYTCTYILKPIWADKQDYPNHLKQEKLVTNLLLSISGIFLFIGRKCSGYSSIVEKHFKFILLIFATFLFFLQICNYFQKSMDEGVYVWLADIPYVEF
jgi:hypothetical protein